MSYRLPLASGWCTQETDSPSLIATIWWPAQGAVIPPLSLLGKATGCVPRCWILAGTSSWAPCPRPSEGWRSPFRTRWRRTVAGWAALFRWIAHASRLAKRRSAAYYVLVLVLQLVPYSLAGGAGVNLGLTYLRSRPHGRGEKWLGLPKEAVQDVLQIYLLVVPLFLIASLWEFWSPW